ncbi:unnamed protein product [Didymodactylos carnosus]|uniref:C2H2-type domain-containing protein n=1 Tax=Didymodactylos carnosus TaxID=1234261 RepID=A0A8S2MVZ3_9BILA|nr:unnamed protein product [Didymodactylos carnosus]
MSCSTCNYVSATSNDLICHFAEAHHAPPIFMCDIDECNRQYKTKCGLQKHQRQKHLKRGEMSKENSDLNRSFSSFPSSVNSIEETQSWNQNDLYQETSNSTSMDLEESVLKELSTSTNNEATNNSRLKSVDQVTSSAVRFIMNLRKNRGTEKLINDCVKDMFDLFIALKQDEVHDSVQPVAKMGIPG